MKNMSISCVWHTWHVLRFSQCLTRGHQTIQTINTTNVSILIDYGIVGLEEAAKRRNATMTASGVPRLEPPVGRAP